jgi:hypothetical protein
MPERKGWVDRKKLLDFHGRNRKPQIALAQEFGFDDYASPAGGLLFSNRSELCHETCGFVARKACKAI